MRTRWLMAMSLALAVVGSGIAVATPGSNIFPTTLATGTFDENIRIKQRAPADLHVVEVRLGPGGHTGWHSHPGAELVLVESGNIRVRATSDQPGTSGCDVATYSAGDGFMMLPRHTFIVSNQSQATDDATFTAVLFGIPPGGSNRIDQPDPGVCPTA